MTDFNKSIETLQGLDVSKMYGEDFFLTWEKSDDELKGVWAVADALRALRAVSYTHLDVYKRQ